MIMCARDKIEKKQYHLRFSPYENYRNSVWAVLASDFFQSYIPIDSHVLDIGAGWGEFINNIDAGQKYAMDINPDGKVRIHSDVTFFHQDCTKQWPVKDESLDVIFTSNFLEHMLSKQMLEQTMTEAVRCLKKRGKIICMGPNIKHIPGGYWDFWDHHVALTEKSIAELLQIKGLRIDKCIDRFLPYSMSQGWTPPMIFVKIYLKIPLLWKLFGKQFLVIASKKTE